MYQRSVCRQFRYESVGHSLQNRGFGVDCNSDIIICLPRSSWFSCLKCLPTRLNLDLNLAPLFACSQMEAGVRNLAVDAGLVLRWGPELLGPIQGQFPFTPHPMLVNEDLGPQDSASSMYSPFQVPAVAVRGDVGADGEDFVLEDYADDWEEASAELSAAAGDAEGASEAKKLKEAGSATSAGDVGGGGPVDSPCACEAFGDYVILAARRLLGACCDFGLPALGARVSRHLSSFLGCSDQACIKSLGLSWDIVSLRFRPCRCAFLSAWSSEDGSLAALAGKKKSLCLNSWFSAALNNANVAVLVLIYAGLICLQWV